MDDETAPAHLNPLQRFGFDVRQVRLGRKLSQPHVAKGTGYSVAYVSKVETGKLVPSVKFVQKVDVVLATHGIFERKREEIMNGDHPSWFAPYVDLEKTATSILNYSVSLIMGMLQTPDYAESVFRAAHPREKTEGIKIMVEARQDRRKVMLREKPPLLWVILHENCLRMPVGGNAVMKKQLEHLIREAESPNVTLQVLPSALGAPPATESFTVLKFASRTDIAFAETAFTGQIIEAAPAVAQAKEMYDWLRAAALDPSQSLTLLRKILKEYSTMNALPTFPLIAWEKSSYSNGQGGECIEFSRTLARQGSIPVRDSKDPQGPSLAFRAAAWSAFVAGVKAGDFPTV